MKREFRCLKVAHFTSGKIKFFDSPFDLMIRLKILIQKDLSKKLKKFTDSLKMLNLNFEFQSKIALRPIILITKRMKSFDLNETIRLSFENWTFLLLTMYIVHKYRSMLWSTDIGNSKFKIRYIFKKERWKFRSKWHNGFFDLKFFFLLKKSFKKTKRVDFSRKF